MKIVISAIDGNLNAAVDPRFGRAAYFLLTDPGTLDFEAFPNQNADAGGAAGIQSAQWVVKNGAQAVITGRCGPNAFRVLDAAGVQVFDGAEGTVGEVISAWKNQELNKLEKVED
ncbi:MAG: NifB/NifX family molybdenum-iron cluster-binding protein [Calditrichia bacterium]